MTTNGLYIKSKAAIYLMSGFYVLAGINHFIHPEFYIGLIPDYFAKPYLINQLSGIIELFFGLGILFSSIRKPVAYGVIIMLVAFIPSHIFFIQIGSCISDGLCVSPWIAWIRLIVIHPLLIFWAYKVGKFKF